LNHDVVPEERAQEPASTYYIPDRINYKSTLHSVHFLQHPLTADI